MKNNLPKRIEGIPVESLSVLNLKSDETLLIKVAAIIDRDHLKRLEKEISEKIGGKVLILDPCFELQRIIKSDKLGQVESHEG